MRATLRSTGLALATVVLLGAAGCGVSYDSGPHAIPANQIPFHLLSPATTTTTRPPAAVSVPVTVYFVGPTRQSLVPSARSVAPPETLTEVLDVLLAGPTTLEAARRVTTALSSNVRVRSATVSGTIATINFNTAFEEISGTAQVLAVAQVVYTVTGQLGTEVGVQFAIDGTPVPVPTATGAEVTGPVHLLDYVALAPASSSRPTAAAPGATTTTTTATATAG